MGDNEIMNNYHLADDGFAVWVVPIDDKNNMCDIDLHINQWIMPEKKRSSVNVFVDFGIRVYSARNASKICFYAPFNIEERDCVDLSMLLQDRNIARGIFNTNCDINLNDRVGIFELNYNFHESNVLELSKHIEKCSGGSLISFDVSSVVDKLSKDELYIRFRIKNKNMGEFLSKESKTLKSFASLLSSPIIKEEYTYTVRVNEMRCLPDAIRYNSILQKQKTKKIILTVCMNGKFVINSSTCYKTRVLEEQLYNNYVPSGFVLNNCMVYQWLQEKHAGNHYNLTTTFYKEYVNKKSLLLYALFVVLLSALGGGVVEAIKYIVS